MPWTACTDTAFFIRLASKIFASHLCSMPKPNIPCPTPIREALLECFSSIARLVRPELRRQLVLVGGAASIAHSSP